MFPEILSVGNIKEASYKHLDLFKNWFQTTVN